MNKVSYITDALTPRNCLKKGYYWIRDMVFYDETFIVFKELFEKGYILGKAKEKGLSTYGFYVPQKIATERLSNIFNPLLTPKDAARSRYEYVDDIIYNLLTPDEEIVELITRYGYKLGSPTQSDPTESFFGLYMPLD